MLKHSILVVGFSFALVVGAVVSAQAGTKLAGNASQTLSSQTDVASSLSSVLAVNPGAPDMALRLVSDDLDQDLLDALSQAEDSQTAANIEHELLQTWTRSGSDTVDLLMVRAAAAMESQDYTVALELLSTVVEIKPDYTEGWNRRATVYYLIDEYALSVADIQQTLLREPRHFGALSGLGLIFQSIGKKKSALAAFEAALSVHPYLESATSAAEELEVEVNGIRM